MMTDTEHRTAMTSNERRITILHLATVARYLLDGGQLGFPEYLAEFDRLAVNFVRGHIGYETTEQSATPRGTEQTERELEAQLDLLFDAVVRVAPKAAPYRHPLNPEPATDDYVFTE